MALIVKVPSEGEQNEEFTKIMKEMESAFEFKKERAMAHDHFVSPDINKKCGKISKLQQLKNLQIF